jgi:diaminohydroxyphosphoribosylaminopyrimidine deaminase/5-amino-6-(5-phosphoribosylamino)uracil reductase
MFTPPPLPPALLPRLEPPQEHDDDWMRRALALARRGLGRTGPNPSVGCVIVRDGAVLGEGFTQPGGRPHAETVALADARQRGLDVAGATLYVTLEPCSHHGLTPPCADACAQANPARVVAALVDPDPRVSGRGLLRLLDAGIPVTCGVLQHDAWRVHLPFVSRILRNRPYVIAKVAMSLDGRIAARDGSSFPLTGEEARARVHLLRDRVDAILVGRGTVEADDPRLTCRLGAAEAGEGGPHDPARFVLDPGLRAPLGAKVFSPGTTVVVAQGEGERERRAALEGQGVALWEAPRGGDGRLDLVYTLERMAQQGLSSVLVEGGGETLAGFFEADLIDAWVAHVAPALIGGRGARSPLEGQGVGSLAARREARFQWVRAVGQDIELAAAVHCDVYGLD